MAQDHATVTFSADESAALFRLYVLGTLVASACYGQGASEDTMEWVLRALRNDPRYADPRVWDALDRTLCGLHDATCECDVRMADDPRYWTPRGWRRRDEASSLGVGVRVLPPLPPSPN